MEGHSPETKKPLTNFEYVDFTVERELWNKYKLEDKAILKTKFVLINLFAEKNYKEKLKNAQAEKGRMASGIKFQSSTVQGVEVPFSLLGDPGEEVYSFKELESAVTKEDLDFEAISETWNIYRLDGEVEMRIRNIPARVRRTSKCDNNGVPIYLVDYTADIKVVPKS